MMSRVNIKVQKQFDEAQLADSSCSLYCSVYDIVSVDWFNNYPINNWFYRHTAKRQRKRFFYAQTFIYIERKKLNIFKIHLDFFVEVYLTLCVWDEVTCGHVWNRANYIQPSDINFLWRFDSFLVLFGRIQPSEIYFLWHFDGFLLFGRILLN